MSAGGLEIVSLSTGYPGRRVLSGLHVPMLRAGTLTTVIGPNAAGKTTLLRALAGLLPASGEARFDGRDLLRMRPAELARIVTYMPQALPQGVALTAIEAVVTALQASGQASGRASGDPHGGEAEARAEAMLRRLGIAHLALSGLDQLSGGQRQLVSLAQAIVRRPRVLLLDEPTSALDPRHQFEVMNAVHEIARQQGMVALVVLHDLNLALRWADQVVLVHDGGVAAAGAPEEAITPGLLASAYRVSARVERCSQGRLQVIYDGLA